MKYIYECRILLVDDNTGLQKMVRDILSREGFTNVDTASDCAGAMLYFSRQIPDIVILDIGLPDGDGFSLMQQIRSVSDIPVLFLSARDEDNDRLLGLGLGADDYITKPFLPKELMATEYGIGRRLKSSPNISPPGISLLSANGISGIIRSKHGGMEIICSFAGSLRILSGNITWNFQKHL